MKLLCKILAILTLPIYLVGQTYAEKELLELEDGNAVEFIYFQPKGKGPFPVLFALHGGGQPAKHSPGASVFLKAPVVRGIVAQGIAVVAISQPGFGKSSGPRDLAGPSTQRAVHSVIEHFHLHPMINASRMGILGIGRGAAAAAMVFSQSSKLSLQILTEGWYDLEKNLALLPTHLESVKQSVAKEIELNEEAYFLRSPILHTPGMRGKTLILHSEFDDRMGLSLARKLHQQLEGAGRDSTFKMIPGATHAKYRLWHHILPFLREHLLDLHGVGMRVDSVPPTIQILEILPDQPAALSGRLFPGDTILSISPLGDDEEISTIGMDLKTFISHALGEKGSSLRLKVAHFDQSIEDVVLQRGTE